MRIGIVATSSPVGPVELQIGRDWLESEGFEVVVHPSTLDRDFLFAGTDEDRARALRELADDESIDAIWCARGGYGAARVVNLLMDQPAPRQRKLLVGYSDVTILHEFVRQRWGWHTLHAVMPASNWGRVSPAALRETFALVRRRRVELAYESIPLRRLDGEPGQIEIESDLVGGNLTLWATMAGTALSKPRGRILFLEDVGEKLYRLDRYVVQLEQSGMLQGVLAIVLGDFTNCEDESNTMLAPIGPGQAFDWSKHPTIPQRPTYSLEQGLHHIFDRLTRRHGIAVYTGLPVGHGPNFHPLPLGARFRLDRQGTLKLMDWGWIAKH